MHALVNTPKRADRESFSALQRAENSSMIATLYVLVWLSLGFSALQRAENSSMVRRSRAYAAYLEVSVLFSEPKIPQLAMIQRLLPGSATGFSALQRAENSSIQRSGGLRGARPGGFSALQRAENSSIDVAVDESENDAPFQCSSASRKFLNRVRGSRGSRCGSFQCSSASRKFLNRWRLGRRCAR